jgi:branched-chain amino acid transport system ATP-binding protein
MHLSTHHTVSAPISASPLLTLRDVTVKFGGLVAVNGIDLDVAHGDRIAVLGPNGAGKTTLFNVITGDIVPTSGHVEINGTDCTAVGSRFRPSLGVSRTYQRTRLFKGLSVQENLLLALIGKAGSHRSLRRRAITPAMRLVAAETASSIWLADDLHALVGSLSHGQQRQLEVGMAVITMPQLMLLDEPASGLSRGERERLLELLQQLSPNTTLLLIEHDMEVALAIARRVVVMSDGSKIVEGSPTEIRANRLVHQIYLGSRG